MFVIELLYKRPLTEIDARMKAHVNFLKKYYASGNFLVSGRRSREMAGSSWPSPGVARKSKGSDQTRMWTNLRRRGFGLADLTRLMSAAPAKLARLDHRKGRLAAGFDADIVIWDPEARIKVVPEMIKHRHKLTPYQGMELFGVIERTFSRGRSIDEDHKNGHLLVN